MRFDNKYFRYGIPLNIWYQIMIDQLQDFRKICIFILFNQYVFCYL